MVAGIPLLLTVMAAVTMPHADGPAQAPAPAPASGANAGLNHFYVVLDEETFSAARSSEFFQEELAVVDTGLPGFSAPDSSSSRFYVRGRNTYMELLGPQNPFAEPVRKIGIALGVDELAELDSVQRAWSEHLGGKVERTRVQWTKSPKPVPWYDAVEHARTNSNPHAVLWAAAYLPEFLPWLYPQRSVRRNSVARADFLAPRFAPDRLFEDVIGLVIAVPAELRLEIARQLEVLGYERRETKDALVLEGGGWKLTLVEAAAEHSRLQSVEFSMNREHEGPAVVHIGPSSTLVFGPGRAATWRFR